jgi:hypothetical protein
MSKHRFEVEVEVDDDALDRHDAYDDFPPLGSPDDWDLFELVRACGEEIAVGEVTNYEELPS